MPRTQKHREQIDIKRLIEGFQKAEDKAYCALCSEYIDPKYLIRESAEWYCPECGSTIQYDMENMDDMIIESISPKKDLIIDRMCQYNDELIKITKLRFYNMYDLDPEKKHSRSAIRYGAILACIFYALLESGHAVQPIDLIQLCEKKRHKLETKHIIKGVKKLISAENLTHDSGQIMATSDKIIYTYILHLESRGLLILRHDLLRSGSKTLVSRNELISEIVRFAKFLETNLREFDRCKSFSGAMASLYICICMGLADIKGLPRGSRKRTILGKFVNIVPISESTIQPLDAACSKILINFK